MTPPVLPAPRPPARRPGLRAHLRHLLLAASLGALCGPLAAVGVAQPWHVSGHSMEPTIRDGSVLLVDTLGPRVAGLARGDVVVVPVPPGMGYPHPILVKRIVAVAGDRVRIDRGVLRVNGVPAAEPYLAPGTVTLAEAGGLDLVVPPGAVFVMGDHRSNSFDSTSFGPVPTASIVGRAWIAIEPGGGLALPGVAAAAP